MNWIGAATESKTDTYSCPLKSGGEGVMNRAIEVTA